MENSERESLDFERFVQAVEQYELRPAEVKATAHTSAVSVRWSEIEELRREEK